MASDFEKINQILDHAVDDCVKHAAAVTYENLKREKKWFHVECFYDDQIKRPYLVVKYSEDSYNRIVIPVFSEESLSPAELQSIFNLLHPPGDPDSYEDGLIMSLVSSDMSIVYHNICAGLVPPTARPTSSIPRSRKLRQLEREKREFD